MKQAKTDKERDKSSTYHLITYSTVAAESEQDKKSTHDRLQRQQQYRNYDTKPTHTHAHATWGKMKCITLTHIGCKKEKTILNFH